MNLIDTSALYDMIAQRKAEAIRESFILDLTIYEFGNAVWKQHRRSKGISKNECRVLIESFTKLGLRPIRIDTADLAAISAIAGDYDVTVYDAAYIYYAKRHSLDLITSDEKLGKAWANAGK